VYGSEIHAHRRRNRNRPEIEASHNAVDSQMPLPETRRELKRPDQQRSQSAQPVRKKPPAHGKEIRPGGMRVVNDEALVAPQHEQEHQSEREKQTVFEAAL